MASMFMSGDLGGTNFRISLFECEGDGPLRHVPAGAPCPGVLLHHSRFRTAEYENFADIIGDFLAECKAEGIDGGPTTACFSCAGPVQPNNTVQMTNIQRWPAIDGDALAEQYGVSGGVKLINDFVAAGYGLLTLTPDDYIVLQEGDPQPSAPVACVGAGTGLGECYLTYDAQGVPTCWGSEGGHTEWSPRNETEIGLQSYLKEKHTAEGSK
jgi:glucokinase